MLRVLGIDRHYPQRTVVQATQERSHNSRGVSLGWIGFDIAEARPAEGTQEEVQVLVE